MRPRAFVCAVLAAAATLPAAARAGSINAITVPSSVPGGSPATVACSFQCAAGGMSFCNTTVDRFVFTATAGAFASGATTATILVPPSTTSAGGATSWTAPPAAGAATIACYAATSAGSSPAVASSATVTVTAPAPAAPVIAALDAPASAFVGSAIPLTATATDPGGLPIAYSWGASGGSFEPATPVGASATWVAPASAGAYTLTVTATNGAGASSQRAAVVQVLLSVYQSTLPVAIRAPSRLAVTAGGDLLAAGGDFRLLLLTPRGELRATMAFPGGVTAVAASGARTWVGTEGRGIVELDAATGRALGTIPYRFAKGPSGLAVDAARDRVWAANYDGGLAVALRRDGSAALRLGSANGRRLVRVADVAYDADRDEVWVAERASETGPMVHAFRGSDGLWLRSWVTFGAGAAKAMSVGGIAVAGGRLFVADALSGVVQVLSAATGVSLGTLGMKGIDPGALYEPRGLALLANGDLAVADSALDRVDRFGTGAPLPTCAGDADCDGLPDDWELAHGLDPNAPADALRDSDGDGLSDREEYALGTDPRNADTDGDGMGDGREVSVGRSPLDAADARPVVTVAAPTRTGPGLVRLDAVVSGGQGCSASWSQLAGAAVSLRGADGFSPSFVARSSGAYRFEAIARCGAATSLPATAEVVVVNVPPIADAGPTVVATPGRRINLSGAFSSDANGDAITYSWKQVAGPATFTSPRGATLAVRPTTVGYHAWELTVSDGAGGRSSAVVPVVVVDGPFPTAAVTEPVVAATVGVPVALDASASWPSDATFTWQQVAPPAAGISGTTPSIAFTPPASGRYVLEVTAWKGALRSPPARVTVLASADGALPAAAADAPASGAVGTAVTLDGSGSSAPGGGVHAWAWRQVAGPAAGLDGADTAVASVTPFAPGAYAFELTVVDAAGAWSAPARVAFTVAGAGALPVAVASAPATAVPGELVILDGHASTGASRFEWTQISGPWVALQGASATQVFTAPAAGSYAFELVVDDGTVRSAPVVVTIEVQ